MNAPQDNIRYQVLGVTFDELEAALNKVLFNEGKVKWVLESPMIEPASFILIIEFPLFVEVKDGS